MFCFLDIRSACLLFLSVLIENGPHLEACWTEFIIFGQVPFVKHGPRGRFVWERKVLYGRKGARRRRAPHHQGRTYGETRNGTPESRSGQEESSRKHSERKEAKENDTMIAVYGFFHSRWSSNFREEREWEQQK
jgi:hypothetical protein